MAGLIVGDVAAGLQARRAARAVRARRAAGRRRALSRSWTGHGGRGRGGRRRAVARAHRARRCCSRCSSRCSAAGACSGCAASTPRRCMDARRRSPREASPASARCNGAASARDAIRGLLLTALGLAGALLLRALAADGSAAAGAARGRGDRVRTRGRGRRGRCAARAGDPGCAGSLAGAGRRARHRPGARDEAPAGCARSCGCSPCRATGTTSACSASAWATPPSRCSTNCRTRDPARHTEAVVRSAEFFNCNPNLAGLALGRAGAGGARWRAGRADRAAAHGALRSAGRAGRPALLGRRRAGAVGAGDRGVVLGAGAGRSRGSCWRTTRCASARRGGRSAPGCARACRSAGRWDASWLPRAAERVGPVAGFAVGLAIPLAGRWLMHGPRADASMALAVILAAGWRRRSPAGAARTTAPSATPWSCSSCWQPEGW